MVAQPPRTNHRTSPRTSQSIVAACLGLAAGLATGQLDQWGTGPGGNSLRNSMSSEVGPNAANEIWRGSSRGDILETQPFIGDGFVVTGRIESFTIPVGSWIVAQDLFTGTVLWEVQLPYNDNAANPDYDAEWRGRVTSVRDDRVYATRAGNTRSGPIYALNAADGSILWTSQNLITDGSTEGNAFAPNGDLIVGSQVAGAANQFSGTIQRIDKDTGQTIWSTNRSCPTSNGCSVAVADGPDGNGRVYYFEAGPFGPVVTAADLTTGAVLYSSTSGDLGGGFIQQVNLFVGQDGTIYVPRGQQGLPGELPGTEIDTFFALVDTGSSLDLLYGIPAGFVPFSTSGTTSDGSVYAYRTPENTAGQLTGELIVLRLDSTGTIINQSQPLPTTTVAPSPRVAIGADDTIYLSTEEVLVSLNPDLTENWRIDDWVDLGFPALGQDGVLVVSSGGTDLRAFQTPSLCAGDIADDFGFAGPDGQVSFGDFLFALTVLGPCPGGTPGCAFDLADDFGFEGADGQVSFGDFLFALTVLGPCP